MINANYLNTTAEIRIAEKNSNLQFLQLYNLQILYLGKKGFGRSFPNIRMGFITLKTIFLVVKILWWLTMMILLFNSLDARTWT